MITGWLLKIVVIVAIIGGLAVEIGSPIIARAQVDGAAHNMADDATASYFQNQNPDSAREVADKIAAKEGVTIEEFGVQEDGRVRVKVFKEARSFALKKISQLKKFYEVRVTAVGESPGK